MGSATVGWPPFYDPSLEPYTSRQLPFQYIVSSWLKALRLDPFFQKTFDIVAKGLQYVWEALKPRIVRRCTLSYHFYTGAHICRQLTRRNID